MSSVLAKRALIAHPDSMCDVVSAIEVELVRGAAGVLVLRYVVIGTIDDLLLPAMAASERTEGLWQNTCFEAFAQKFDGYVEYNFSPSTQWAVYRFDSYREGMTAQASAAPRIDTLISMDRFELIVGLKFPQETSLLGLSAVIEEKSGRKSYWALAHPTGKPDFHHRDCFALDLAAAMRP